MAVRNSVTINAILVAVFVAVLLHCLKTKQGKL